MKKIQEHILTLSDYENSDDPEIKAEGLDDINDFLLTISLKNPDETEVFAVIDLDQTIILRDFLNSVLAIKQKNMNG